MGARAELAPSRRLAAALIMAALALVALQSSDDEDAVGPGGAMPAPTLAVPSLQSLVTDEAPLRLRVRVRNRARAALSDLRLVMTVHGRLTSRFALQQSLDDEPVTGVVHAATRSVSPVPARGARTVSVRQNLDQLGLSAADTSATVHPVRLALQSDGEVVDEVVTAAVVAARDARAPLRVGGLLPLTSPPAPLPNARLDATAARRLIEPDKAVPSMLRAVGRHPQTPVTLATDGMALTTLERMQDGFTAVADDGTVRRHDEQATPATAARRVLARVRDVAAQPGTDQIALPYGRADLVALARHERLTGQRPYERVLWPPAGLNATTLDQLGGVAESVVLSDDMMSIESHSLTPPPRRRLQAGEAGTLPALAPDPWIEQALADNGSSPALTTARVLAAVASVHSEQPAVGNRGLLIAPPADTPVNGAVIDSLLSALETASFSQLTDLGGLRRTGVDNEPPVATLSYPDSAREAELTSDYIDALRGARAHVGSLASLMAQDQSLVGRLDRQLLQAGSTAYRTHPDDGRALLRSVGAVVADVEAAVSVPEVPPVTLAAEGGTLPVRLRSTADTALRVRVTLRSAAYEVINRPVREIELPANQDRLLEFDVRAAAPGGTSPVRVIVEDPDGIDQLATNTIVVRSTAVPVTGAVVTVAAALFLLLALWRQILRRRQRHPVYAAGHREHEPTTAGR
ncbi:MAG: hypothetical protein BRC31_03040 [Actinobacteria bacterium QS_5_72_10]|nr:MAG: hypothetical protein BRC31_03040 [Actinobacteria bacterium QS_5_72_10]